MYDSLEYNFIYEWRACHQKVSQDEVSVELEAGCQISNLTSLLAGLAVIKNDVDSTILQGLQVLPCSGQIVSQDVLGLFGLRLRSYCL